MDVHAAFLGVWTAYAIPILIFYLHQISHLSLHFRSLVIEKQINIFTYDLSILCPI